MWDGTASTGALSGDSVLFLGTGARTSVPQYTQRKKKRRKRHWKGEKTLCNKQQELTTPPQILLLRSSNRVQMSTRTRYCSILSQVATASGMLETLGYEYVWPI